MQNYFILLNNKIKITNIAKEHNSVPAKMLLKLPTYIGFAENQLSRSVLSFTYLP